MLIFMYISLVKSKSVTLRVYVRSHETFTNTMQHIQRKWKKLEHHHIKETKKKVLITYVAAK